MNETDAQLIQHIQAAVPLTPEPWQALASEAGLPTPQVIDRVAQWRSEGLIRRIGGLFDATALGYRQALVALAVSPDKLDAAGQAAAEHPGVSHCYGRQDERYNLWLTLAVSPASKLGLEQTVAALAGRAGSLAELILPTVRRFKLNVQLRVADGQCKIAHDSQPRPTQELELTADHIQAVNLLQRDLPIQPQPFARLVENTGLTEEQLLTLAAELQAAGMLRRYAAVLNHRSAGARANLLVAWEVADGDAAGQAAAENSAVSHCYLRPAGPDWPYTLYTMIHGQSREACLASVEQIANAIAPIDHRLLWTTREYKKQPAKLFSPQEATWESQVI